jgi:hypothetical protein
MMGGEALPWPIEELEKERREYYAGYIKEKEDLRGVLKQGKQSIAERVRAKKRYNNNRPAQLSRKMKYRNSNKDKIRKRRKLDKEAAVIKYHTGSSGANLEMRRQLSIERVIKLLELNKISDDTARDLISMIGNGATGYPYNFNINDRDTNDNRFVYMIRLSNTDRYKIGIASNMNTRMGAIKNASPFNIKLVYSKRVNNAEGLERKLHLEYRGKKIIREWFCLNDADVAKCKEAIDGNSA